jgi:putative Holliday junction resolvase
VIVTTRTGVRVAIDVGTARVGVAASDIEGRLAFPVTVLKRDRRAQRDLDELVTLVSEREAIEVLVGHPQTLRGRDSSSTVDARKYAALLAARIQPLPVRLVDERLSTVSAQQQLHAAGLNTKQSRSVIDAAAAVVLLETALDRERNTGAPAGEQVLP